MEHRINTFIEDLKKNWPLKKEDVKKAVESKINHLLQKKTSLSSETNSHWKKILSEKKFRNRDKKIEAYRKVTYQDIIEMFNTLFFENPRRFNLKVYSAKHITNEEIAQTNQDFYKQKVFKA